MAAALGALTPKLAALPGTTARGTIANLLPTLVSEARAAFQDFEGSVGRDLSRWQGEPPAWGADVQCTTGSQAVLGVVGGRLPVDMASCNAAQRTSGHPARRCRHGAHAGNACLWPASLRLPRMPS